MVGQDNETPVMPPGEPRNPKARRWGKAGHPVITGEPLRGGLFRPCSRQQDPPNPVGFALFGSFGGGFDFSDFRPQHSAD